MCGSGLPDLPLMWRGILSLAPTSKNAWSSNLGIFRPSLAVFNSSSRLSFLDPYAIGSQLIDHAPTQVL
jgi:hypothetical protein